MPRQVLPLRDVSLREAGILAAQVGLPLLPLPALPTRPELSLNRLAEDFVISMEVSFFFT